MNDYILYTDRKENFSCDIALEGARLNDSFARIILETNEINYVFNGTIDASGKCEIPIKALKGLMEVRDSGKMVLEVVADDTYFRPWESNFIVDAHTKLEVKINEQAVPSKPKIQVSINQKKDVIAEEKPKQKAKKTIQKPKKSPINEAVVKLTKALNKSGVNGKNLKKNKLKLKTIMSEYFKLHNIYNQTNKDLILKRVVEKLIRG